MSRAALTKNGNAMFFGKTRYLRPRTGAGGILKRRENEASIPAPKCLPLQCRLRESPNGKCPGSKCPAAETPPAKVCCKYKPRRFHKTAGHSIMVLSERPYGCKSLLCFARTTAKRAGYRPAEKSELHVSDFGRLQRDRAEVFDAVFAVHRYLGCLRACIEVEQEQRILCSV